MPQRRKRSFVMNFVMDQGALEYKVEKKTKILKTNMPESIVG
jgi:hypothetical protein